MKPLFHPALDDVTVEGILHALADPTRVAIYAQIVASNSEHTCASFQKMRERPIPKSTLSVHFKALREAGLIRSERQGVEMRNTSRSPEIEQRFPGLVPAILSAHVRQMAGVCAAKAAATPEPQAGAKAAPRRRVRR
jgi:DNA-binding transcriptional ArsR family regulator